MLNDEILKEVLGKNSLVIFTPQGGQKVGGEQGHQDQNGLQHHISENTIAIKPLLSGENVAIG